MNEIVTLERVDQQIPWSIRLLGALFLLSGVPAAGELVVHFLDHRSFSLNLAMVNVLVGLGLMLRSNVARRVALFELMFIGFGFPLMLLFAWGCKFYWEIWGFGELEGGTTITTFTISDWRTASFGECLFDTFLGISLLIVIWASVRVLSRHKTVKLFSELQGHFQIDLYSLMCLVGVMAIAFISLRAEFLHHEREVVRKFVPSTSATANSALVAYGFRRHRWEESRTVLDFVVIDRTAGASVTTFGSTSEGGYAVVKGPNGERYKLPDEQTMVQVDDRTIQTYEGFVSKQQLEEYLDTKPAELSISELLGIP